MKETKTLLVTHTDRDGVFSGAALLRALGDPDGPDVILTQGSYLADELEEIADAGRRYQRIFVCDSVPRGERKRGSTWATWSPGGRSRTSSSGGSMPTRTS